MTGKDKNIRNKKKRKWRKKKQGTRGNIVKHDCLRQLDMMISDVLIFKFTDANDIK
jgi:hypothetical protein